MSPKKSHIKRYWYKQHRKWKTKKIQASLLSIPAEVRLVIYGYIFVSQRMIDATTTEKNDYRRKYGVQSLLFVNKIIRREAMESFYRYCVFEIPHFRLHKKHRRLNPMIGLESIQNMCIVWTMPPHARFTSTKVDDQLLNRLKSLKELVLDLKGRPYIRVDPGVDEASLHSNLLAKLPLLYRNLPLWMRKLIENASEHITIYLNVYFFAALVAAPTFFAVSSKKCSCFISSSNSFGSVPR